MRGTPWQWHLRLGTLGDMDRDELESLAVRVRAALDAGDLSGIEELLTPDARWGPPEEPEVGCRSRAEVVAWWSEARDRGMSATVTEVVAGPDALLVGLRVTTPPSETDPGGTSERWQVLGVREGKVADIRGFDDRAVAAARAGAARG
jgi:ketosteroid isomerase-like protein